MAWTVTIDNGSTFTDACLFAEDRLHMVKVLTTPYDLMRCFAEVFRALGKTAGLDGEGDLLRRVEEVRYSTTSGTNALLVRRGVRVGLITGPEGERDFYGLRDRNPELLDAIVADRVASVALADASADEADERILGALRRLLGLGAQWIVVSLPSPRGPQEEQLFKRRTMKLLPGHLLGAVPVLFSYELCFDPDDRRRTATSLLNGFLHREMARFLYHADGWVRDGHVAQPLRIMRNDGGCGRVAKTTAVRTLDSGPMGGLGGAAHFAGLIARPRMITLDVGGTSSDIGVVENGREGLDLFGSVHDLPLSFSFPTLRTVALGGGSIFRVEGGRLRIGPESAGALPGPACFGRGGQDPTLTDAALVAGHLEPESFAGGSIAVRSELAEKAIAERVAAPLGLAGAREGADAMIEAFAERLAGEILLVCRRRSWEPQDVVLLAYGGSGPLVAGLVAARLGVDEWIVPTAAASFSALGVGFAPLAHEYRALVDPAVTDASWNETLAGLRERAERDMFGEGASGNGSSPSLRLRNEADGRDLAPEDRGRLATGRLVLDYRIERGGRIAAAPAAPDEGPSDAGREARRTIRLQRQTLEVPVLGVATALRSDGGRGPALLESPWWSAPLHPGWSWRAEPWGIRVSR